MGCICPKCKSNNIISIMYGYPVPEAAEEAEKGNLKLGGCEVFIGSGQPDRYCKECENEWCVDNFLVDDIVKIRFRYWSNWGCYDPKSVQEDQWAFEVFPDGTAKYFDYPRDSRKCMEIWEEELLIKLHRLPLYYPRNES